MHKNNLIRDFMKANTLDADLSFYESDWNMLMPVFIRINEMGKNAFGINWTFSMNENSVCMEVLGANDLEKKLEYKQIYAVYAYNYLMQPIDAVYNAVIHFITWYNNLTPEKKTHYCFP